MNDLETIVSNLDTLARETLIEIALSMASNKASGWTGGEVWEINYSQGSVGTATVQTKRSLFTKSRRVRHGGIK